ncbi:MAG: COX15/CtaA family protein [Bdellovibrionales bacterium]|nr:COX15/CtaA family protein [Bdellovibrionales bacterium]
MTTPESPLANERPAVRLWLVAICVLIVAMVSIGGVTRLTGSGLSITDWNPIMGAIPPLTHEAWEAAFAKYREIPQYRIVNPAMDLSAFKSIFFWEWFHRLVGRLIGVVAFLPGAYFWARGRISKRLAMRVLVGVALGGLQGALGWFMVKSGLSERTSVSHFRLAAHLSLALLILSYFVWLTRSVFTGDRPLPASEATAYAFLRPKFRWVVLLFALQIIYGAFVAGLKAGFAFNTFPLMDGSLVPGNLLALEPAWSNPFENPATVQWIHRTLGWTAFFVANGLWLVLRFRKRAPRGPLRFWTTALAHMTIAQFTLGVLTLIFVVPIALGGIHQLGAAILVVLLTILGHTLHRNTNGEVDAPYRD